MSWGKLGYAIFRKWDDNDIGAKLFPKRAARIEARRAAREAAIDREFIDIDQVVAELERDPERAEQLARAREEWRRGIERTSEGIEYEVTEKPDMKKLFELISNLRTSTKSGFAGLAVMAVMATPLAEPVNAYLMEACASPEGPLPFLVAGGVTWAVMFVSARLSKTPAVPGKL